MCLYVAVEDRRAGEMFSYRLRGGRYVINALCSEVHLRRGHVIDSLVSGASVLSKHLTRRNVVHLKDR